MKTLTQSQINLLRDQLYKDGATPSQASALLPFFAQEIEHFMWIGLPFEAALHKVQLEADNCLVHYLRSKHTHALVMSDKQLEESSLDDLVFANRNGAYGAYDLRKAYSRAVVNALLLTLGIVLMVLAALEAYPQEKWTHSTWGGGAWIAGIFLVAFACFRFYIERMTMAVADEG